jgi:DMSO reductase anchor subunit
MVGMFLGSPCVLLCFLLLLSCETGSLLVTPMALLVDVFAERFNGDDLVLRSRLIELSGLHGILQSISHLGHPANPSGRRWQDQD